MLQAYYNDNDAFVAQWLRNLIAAGHLPAGEVDETSINDLTTSRSFPGHAHFFAGIGGWPLALALAGWPDEWPVWTGSCPCQPFSIAGRKDGTDDERHLWPPWRELIREHRPATIFGEQVASNDGRDWLSGVFSDLELLGYRVAGADLCAASVGAPHRRQRLFWVADSERSRLEERERKPGVSASQDGAPERKGTVSGSGLGDTSSTGTRRHGGAIPTQEAESPREWLNPWDLADCTFITGADGKTRRIKSGIEPLVTGLPGRVGQLRAYGNAIIPQVGALFVRAYMESVTHVT